MSRSERRMDDELEAFVALLTEEKIAAGMRPDDARRAALIETAGIEQVKEAVRDVRPTVFLDRLSQDLKYGLRLAARAPGLNLAVVLALALGIGATSATFSVVDAVLLRPLAYADADRLVAVMHRRTNPVSPANFLDWQRLAAGFTTMGAAQYWTPNVAAGGAPEKLYALNVSSEVLPMLGIAPALGRFAGSGDSAAREVVIGDGLWRRLFGADANILARSVMLDGRAYVVVGVMPPEFKFAPFWATRAELWAPLVLGPRATERSGNSLRVFAKLAPGVSVDQARDSMTALAAELEARYPGTNRQVTVTPLKEMVVGNVRTAISVLFAAVGVVLLVACTNVAHMLLARAVSREREVALRAALGAGRRRMVRQFLTESLMLAAAGGGLGLLFAVWAIEALKSLGASSIPRVQSIGLDGRVLVFTVAVSLVTAIVFGLAPALKLSKPEMTAVLHDGDRGSSSGRRRRVSNVLIASEVALAVVLLIGAGLLARSFVALRAVDPGFKPDHLASMVVSVTGTAEGAPARRFAFYQQVLDRLRALPSVESASATNHLPLAGDIWGFPFAIEGRPTPAPGDAPTAAYRLVLPGYFKTIGLPLVRGGDVTEADRDGAPEVVVINQYLADTYWPGENALGKRLRIANAWHTVIGVTKNAVRSSWQNPPAEEVFLPLFQSAQYRDDAGAHVGYLTFVIRTTGDSAVVLPAARASIHDLAPTVPISEVFVMTDVVDQAMLGARFTLVLLGTFAAVALLLSAVGIYGVMSHAIAGRRREISIRLALGATRGRLVARTLGEGMAVTAAGAAIGVVAAALFGNVMSGLLFGVTPDDLPTFVAVVFTLTTVAAIACYLPARRASRIEPQRELR